MLFNLTFCSCNMGITVALTLQGNWEGEVHLGYLRGRGMTTHGGHSARGPACREVHYVFAASWIIVGVIPFTVVTPVWLTLLAANHAVMNPVKEPPEPPTFPSPLCSLPFVFSMTSCLLMQLRGNHRRGGYRSHVRARCSVFPP